jgi:signal transduction histidine kinase
VTDDGVGFTLHDVRDKGGLGLATMRERAEELGGGVTVQSAPGEGTSVRVKLGSSDGYSKQMEASA